MNPILYCIPPCDPCTPMPPTRRRRTIRPHPLEEDLSPRAFSVCPLSPTHPNYRWEVPERAVPERRSQLKEKLCQVQKELWEVRRDLRVLRGQLPRQTAAALTGSLAHVRAKTLREEAGERAGVRIYQTHQGLLGLTTRHARVLGGYSPDTLGTKNLDAP